MKRKKKRNGLQNKVNYKPDVGNNYTYVGRDKGTPPKEEPQENWDEIFSEVVKHLDATGGKYVGQGWEYLKSNFHPPKRIKP